MNRYNEIIKTAGLFFSQLLDLVENEENKTPQSAIAVAPNGSFLATTSTFGPLSYVQLPLSFWDLPGFVPLCRYVDDVLYLPISYMLIMIVIQFILEGAETSSYQV